MFVLEKLWREGLSPSEKYTRKGSEYHKILLRICDAENNLCEDLTEKEKAHFEAYRNAQIELSAVAEREVFIDAFRIGAMLMMDILGDYRGNFYTATEE